MATNIDQLLAKAEEIGSSEIPAGNGNSPEIQEALLKVFEAHPSSWFRSKALGEALNAAGYKCNKVSDVLFAMRKAGKIVKAQKGVYGLDAGKTIPVSESSHGSAAPSDSTDEE